MDEIQADTKYVGHCVKKIVVCSPHPILAAGFRALIAEPSGLTVLDCPGVSELPALLAQKPAQHADLILIDVDYPAFDLSCLAEIKPLAPRAGWILWVQWAPPQFIREAIAAGVRAILRKDASAELYLQCLDRTASGQLWLENEMSQELLRAKAVRLSPRERQLVALLTEGLRNKEIAGRMNITEGTAKAYLSRLFEKTGASDRFELAMFALKNLETDPSGGPLRGPRIFLPLRAVFARRG